MVSHNPNTSGYFFNATFEQNKVVAGGVKSRVPACVNAVTEASSVVLSLQPAPRLQPEAEWLEKVFRDYYYESVVHRIHHQFNH